MSNKRPNVADALQNLRPKNLKNAFEGKEKRSRKQEVSADSKYTAEEKAKMDAEGKGLSGVTKAWKERFNLINETEFWVAVCFNSDEERDTFIDRSILRSVDTVLPHVYRGEAVAEALGIDLEVPAPMKFDNTKRIKMTAADMNFRNKYQVHPDPFPGEFVTSGDLETDLQRDCAGLAEVIRKGQDPEWNAQYGNALDRPHYFIFSFQNMERKDRFMAHTYLAQLGDKYIEGAKAAIIMEVEMGPLN